MPYIGKIAPKISQKNMFSKRKTEKQFSEVSSFHLWSRIWHSSTSWWPTFKFIETLTSLRQISHQWCPPSPCCRPRAGCCLHCWWCTSQGCQAGPAGGEWCQYFHNTPLPEYNNSVIYKNWREIRTLWLSRKLTNKRLDTFSKKNLDSVKYPV